MRLRTRAVGALGAALALAAAAACTDDPAGGGDGPSDAVQEFDETRLVDMVNESSRLLYELESAELRIIQNCLEARHFTVHDQFWFSVREPEEQEALFGADDWGSWLPPLEEAAEYGLGMWATTDEGWDTDAAEEYREYKGYATDGLHGDAGAEGNPDLPDNSAFEALSPQEQYDWYVAFWGEETAASENAHLLGGEAPPTTTEGSVGEIDLGGEFDYVQPEPGGCQREMIDALYEDLQLIEDPEGGEYRSANWSYRPVNPVDDFAVYEGFDALYQERLAAVQGELADCLAEHGHPGWEFDQEGSLPVSDYFYELYEGVADVHDHPDLPDDAPADFKGKKAFEIAFAVELAECGDETGYRETAAQAWADTQEEYYLSIETSVYAWQDEIRGILTKAQDAIEG
jgi:hypothetical protein